MQHLISFALACALLQVTVASDWTPSFNPNCHGECPTDFTSHHLIPHTDPEKYCRCDNGDIVEMNCAGGTIFNPSLQVCDFDTGEVPEAPTSTWKPTESRDLTGCEDNYCPDDDCFDFPNSLDCNLYCHCHHGHVEIKECPSGLHFNPVWKTCDVEGHANCTNIGTPPNQTTVSTEPPTTEAPTSIPTDPTTEPTTKPTTQTIETPSTKPPSVCDSVCPPVWPVEENNHLSYPDDCTKFCHCANDGNWTKDCPEGLHFNPVPEVCDWPWNAGCDPNAITTTEAPPTHPPTAPPTTDSPTEPPTEPTTQPPTAPPTQSPTEPPTAPPTQPPTELPTTKAPTVCDSVCPPIWPVEENNHLPSPDDCTKFCHCGNDGNWTKDCPEGLHFNPVLEVCDWPWNAGCDPNAITTTGARPTHPPTALQTTDLPTEPPTEPSTQPPTEPTTQPLTEPPTAPPTQPPTELPTTKASTVCDSVCPPIWPVEENNHLPYPDDCTKFCHCANDGKWMKECPIANAATGARLHFSPIQQVCDWAESAGCEVTADCDTVCPKEFPIVTNNHLPYPNDCTKFCHCANDGNWEKSCPPNLHFNAARQVCDWPQNVKCN